MLAKNKKTKNKQQKKPKTEKKKNLSKIKIIDTLTLFWSYRYSSMSLSTPFIQSNCPNHLLVY